jgi:hypothetical protein
MCKGEGDINCCTSQYTAKSLMAKEKEGMLT